MGKIKVDIALSEENIESFGNKLQDFLEKYWAKGVLDDFKWETHKI
jgi:hypothetical protein